MIIAYFFCLINILELKMCDIKILNAKMVLENISY